MASPALRQRIAKASTPAPHEQISTKADIEDQGPVISLLDVFRIILTLLATSCALSYYLTSGDSFVWNFQPWFAKPGALKSYFRGPLQFTPAELSLYNGTDAGLPIYLSINRTVFDVTAGRHTYGPGGSYSAFAGKDATRAFVTGCFAEDSTLDLRGAEEVYMVLDEDGDDEADEGLSSGERKVRAERERREARKKVQKEVEKWVNFYRDSKKYVEVGRLVGVPETFEGDPPKLCENAQKGRPKRKRKEQKSAPGKPVQ